MRFHLDHIPKKPGYHLTHHDKLFLIGSCFSTHIGNLLNSYRYRTFQNPSGIVFNPMSVAGELQSVLHPKKTNPNELFQRDGRHYSFHHHSSFFGETADELLSKINERRHEALMFLKEAKCLFITFGTAYYYHHLKLNTVVANCHKQPSTLFEKRLATTSEIFQAFFSLHTELKKVNPHLQIIYTVSPVKHLKDGLIENNLSKAVLLLAIHELTQKAADTFYFPAYELVNDDLRDYRFYKADLAHPNEQAIEYVWEKFSDCFFPPSSNELHQLILSLNKAEAHRSLSPPALEQKQLLEHIQDLKTRLQKRIPELNL